MRRSWLQQFAPGTRAPAIIRSEGFWSSQAPLIVDGITGQPLTPTNEYTNPGGHAFPGTWRWYERTADSLLYVKALGLDPTWGKLIRALAAGAGGGGGGGYGGGGGGRLIIENAFSVFLFQHLRIKIGLGGLTGVYSGPNGSSAGGPTIFDFLRAIGGGGGGSVGLNQSFTSSSWQWIIGKGGDGANGGGAPAGYTTGGSQSGVSRGPGMSSDGLGHRGGLSNASDGDPNHFGGGGGGGEGSDGGDAGPSSGVGGNGGLPLFSDLPGVSTAFCAGAPGAGSISHGVQSHPDCPANAAPVANRGHGAFRGYNGSDGVAGFALRIAA